MFNKFRRVLKNHKGFTLVELMVVVVIIGILVAIAVPLYNSTQETAKLRAHQANIRVIEGAISTFQANTQGANPANNDALKPYIATWPTKPGKYTVTTGVLVADPTKAATETAVGGDAAVIWPTP